MPRTVAHVPLSEERVLDGAVTLADRIGIEAMTIRRLAAELGVKPMTIYHYLPSKRDIVEGMVERVFSEIAVPPVGVPWTEAIRVRCLSARSVLNRHRWAAPLMESRRAPGPMNLGHHEAVLACLRGAGLSWQLTAHAYAILDSYIFGFAFEEATLPSSEEDGLAEAAKEIAAAFDPGQYPMITTFAAEHVLQPGYSFGASFEVGLDLIINGLERLARSEREGKSPDTFAAIPQRMAGGEEPYGSP